MPHRPLTDNDFWVRRETETDQVLNKLAFRAWVEGDEPYSIDILYSHGRGYRALVIDDDGVKVWESAPKKTAEDAQRFAQGLASLYRGLARQKKEGMNDPAAQISYGIEEHQRQRKANHG